MLRRGEAVERGDWRADFGAPQLRSVEVVFETKERTMRHPKRGVEPSMEYYAWKRVISEIVSIIPPPPTLFFYSNINIMM